MIFFECREGDSFDYSVRIEHNVLLRASEPTIYNRLTDPH